ncbi:hypothetical protein N9S22_01530 [Paracoccaceae bacterium]|nr:hypothetical protein [Paracoccaceae bacterium]
MKLLLPSPSVQNLASAMFCGLPAFRCGECPSQRRSALFDMPYRQCPIEDSTFTK